MTGGLRGDPVFTTPAGNALVFTAPDGSVLDVPTTSPLTREIRGSVGWVRPVR